MMKKRTTKWLSLLLTVALLCGVLPTSLVSTAAGGSLLQNGDFETGDAAGWLVPDWCADGVKVGTAYAKEGDYGVSITGDWANLQQTVAVEPDTDYELSFWVKGYGVVYFKSTDGDEIDTVWPADHGDWTQVSYTVNSGSNTAVNIEINCGQSTAYVDGVAFSKVGEPNPEESGKLQNGDFETGNKSGWGGAFQVTGAARHSGSYGASVKGGGWDQINQTVAVMKHTSYRVSFWYKGELTNYNKFDSGSGEAIWDNNVSGDRPYAADWTYFEFIVSTGSHTKIYLEFSANTKASGFCLDDVKMAPVVDTYVTGGLGSVTERDGMVGVAFKFSLKAQVTAEGHNFVSGAVAPVSHLARYPLVRMGAVLTNKASLADDLTLDSVNGKSVINIVGEKVIDVTADSVSYAVRVVNIPNAAKSFSVYARPYYIYKDGDTEEVVYAPTVYEESYHTITDRVNYTDPSKWELYWNEEFGGNTLDTTKWNVAHNASGILYNTNRPENVKVEGGDLVITARKESYNGKNFTSGNVTSDYKFSFLYGRVEIRAKLAWGKGVWPALWTMGDLYLERGDTDGWPYAGEIDIMELVGETDVTEHKNWPWSTPTYEHTSNKYNEANRTATHNIHWGPDRDNHCEVGGLGQKGYVSKYLFDEDNHPADGYHIYGIEWSYRDIKFFIDDIQVGHIWWDEENIYSQNEGGPVYTVRLSSYRQGDGSTGTTAADLDRAFSNPDNPHWLILGVGLCEGWTESGVNTTDGTDMPASMYVDYVRVYQRPNDGNG